MSSIAQKARVILAREAKVPPRERFRRMVASGLINRDGSYRGAYPPFQAGVIEGERRMRLKVRQAQRQALRELRGYIGQCECDCCSALAEGLIAAIDRATRAQKGRVPR